MFGSAVGIWPSCEDGIVLSHWTRLEAFLELSTTTIVNDNFYKPQKLQPLVRITPLMSCFVGLVQYSGISKHYHPFCSWTETSWALKAVTAMHMLMPWSVMLLCPSHNSVIVVPLLTSCTAPVPRCPSTACESDYTCATCFSSSASL